MSNKIVLYGAPTGSLISFEVRDLEGALVIAIPGIENPPGSGDFYCSLASNGIPVGDYEVLVKVAGVYGGVTPVYWNGTDIVLDRIQAATAVWDEPLSLHNQVGSAGAAQLAINTAVELTRLILKYQRNRTKIDQFNFTLTVYDDDGVTPIRVFNLKDFNGLQSLTEVAERV